MKRIPVLLVALCAAALFPFGWVAAEESVKQQIKESRREFHKKARAARQEAGKEFRKDFGKVRAEGRKARLEAKRRIKGESKRD